MADSTNQGDKSKERPDELDLSGLQNFNFASNWSESPAVPSRRDRDADRAQGRRQPRPDRRPPKRRATPGGEADEPRQGREGRGSDDRRDRRVARPRQDRGHERPPPPLWRDSPFDVQVYPDDPILTTLTRAMRHSLRTYELFEIARLVLEKPERYHVSIRYKDGAEEQPRLLHLSVPDGLPFVSEEAAVDHVLRHHLDKFFATDQVEVEPPKGAFQFMARCTLTGDFLSPPNYHRYQPILIQYHQERFPDMPFERFRASIETVKDEEAIQNWLKSMTTQTHYRVAGQEEGEIFETAEQARAHLLRSNKDQVVRAVRVVKLPGARVADIADEGIKPFVVGCIEHQKRFPLDTANGLRGRLRRQDFFIYKRGSRGVSYVCAVKRKFRQPDQVFADSVEQLLKFIEEHDMIHASELPEKFLHLPAAAGEGAAAPGPEAEEKIKRMSIDLRWLLFEGYVTEFSDGRLQAHPVAQQASAKQRPPEDSTQGKAGAAGGEETPGAGDEAAGEKPVEDPAQPEAEEAKAEKASAGSEREIPAPEEAEPEEERQQEPQEAPRGSAS